MALLVALADIANPGGFKKRSLNAVSPTWPKHPCSLLRTQGATFSAYRVPLWAVYPSALPTMPRVSKQAHPCEEKFIAAMRSGKKLIIVRQIMSQNFREMANTHTHSRTRAKRVYLLGGCLMYTNGHRRKLYYLNTKTEVYCLPRQENVISQLEKKEEEFWHIQELGVATWNSETNEEMLYTSGYVETYLLQKVSIRTVKFGAICINTTETGVAFLS
ncbi:hypothetical protein PAL_GLEAN10025244 [Pteropus alecto]|uniref:Uncharacterized protein n=1 Tax=Pteropus alecto TaxID=9402 RepID=L5JPS8_PTEAL|nr:hypothetical protein PAL_GLEAN10025244 [Pteropus alecto]